MANLSEADVQNGVQCTVIAGAHAGKAGRVEDRNVSKGGNVTITVRQDNGGRFKTLARNVRPVAGS
jgi:ribosomal protein S4E